MNSILEKKIEEILDKSNTTSVELLMLKDLFKSLMTESYQVKILAGTILYRARLNNHFIFNKVQDFHSPPSNITKLGRANLPNIPMFYCCEIPGFSLLEVKPKKEGQYISLAAFILKKELNIKLISNGRSNKRWDVSQKNSSINFERYIANLFQKNYADDTEITELYKKTATITSFFLEEASYDGIGYPSICSSEHGDCFALKPIVIDPIEAFLEFVEARTFKVVSYQNLNEFDVECKLVAKTIKSNGDIFWQPVSSCKGHSIHSGILLSDHG